jgi:2-methylisocitrate lyase-like PEP mutase family enzyme
VLIARTDARAVVGLDEAVERANRALAAGADVAFVEAPQTLEELAEIPRRVEGPCLLNIVAGGRTPDVSLQQAAELGYRLVIVPVLLLAAVLAAGDAALEALAATGRHPDGVPVMGVEQIFRRAGAEPWDEVRARYDAD